MEEKRPNVGVAVLIMRDGKFLVGKRMGAHAAGTWGVPGGHLEFGESWEECAIREIKEETGLNVVSPVFLGVTNDVMQEESRHYVTIFMKCECPAEREPIITEPDRFEELRWVDADHLPAPLFSPLARFVSKYPWLL